MGNSPTIVRSELGFARAGALVNDQSNDKHIPSQPLNSNIRERANFKKCEFIDILSLAPKSLDFETMGFDTIDLSQLKKLQKRLELIRQKKLINRDDISLIQKELRGASFTLSSGKKLRLLYVASEGLILRKAGPNFLDINAKEEVTDMNGHGAAEMLHGDQDVFGSPLNKILGPLAPFMFRHNTPNGTNKRSPFFLVNLWIPLEQVTRPLTLMDRRTLNKEEHQLRYALPTDGDDAQAIINRIFGGRKRWANIANLIKPIIQSISEVDIWLFLHDVKQRFYFSSQMNANTAYVFDTLGQPHGSFILPGEDAAEVIYRELEKAKNQLETAGEKLFLNDIDYNDLPSQESVTEALYKSIMDAFDLIRELHKNPENYLKDKNLAAAWIKDAENALDKFVRKSIEIRTFAIITPF